MPAAADFSGRGIPGVVWYKSGASEYCLLHFQVLLCWEQRVQVDHCCYWAWLYFNLHALI